MIIHYLKTAFRNLVRNKFYTIINVAGLSIGIAVAILLLSYCWFELSFDRFHDKKDQIYRVVQDFRIIDKETKRGGTCYELAAVLKETFPEINHVSRLNYYRSTQQDIEITINGKKFIESRKGENLVQADNDIFKIFDIELVQGDTETALEDPSSIIITEEEARKYFGDENPMGSIISIKRVLDEKGQNYKITGIAKKMPDNSHFEFKYMIPIGENPWTRWKFANSWTLTYLTLTEDYPTENLEKMFPELVKNYFTSGIEARFSMSYEDWKKSGGYWNLRLQALKDIHLDGQYSDSHLIKKGKITQIKIYAAIAFLIIFLACINFITLSISQSGTRAMEVGMRKVNGASRKQLIWQFLFESVLLSLIALLVAITIVKLFSSYFNELLEIQNSFNNVGIAFILIALFLVILIVGVFSGSYP
ncbi:MAG: ABC transporter permease, partial [Maribacter sp.]|nr:ABC transporter permease [Maribacter sp.]